MLIICIDQEKRQSEEIYIKKVKKSGSKYKQVRISTVYEILKHLLDKNKYV